MRFTALVVPLTQSTGLSFSCNELQQNSVKCNTLIRSTNYNTHYTRYVRRGGCNCIRNPDYTCNIIILFKTWFRHSVDKTDHKNDVKNTHVSLDNYFTVFCLTYSILISEKTINFQSL